VAAQAIQANTLAPCLATRRSDRFSNAPADLDILKSRRIDIPRPYQDSETTPP
jgi:hypothetical protein